MIETFKIGKGLTAPVLRGTVERENDETVNISGDSAVFRMWNKQTREVVVDNEPADIISATQVEYEFSALETATPGDYEGIFIITYAVGGGTEMVPGGAYGEPEYIPIEVVDIP